MKSRIYIVIMGLLGIALGMQAQSIDGVSVSDVSTQRNGKFIDVGMNLDFSNLNVESNRAVLITPRLVNGNDSVDLKSIGIYGRRRYYHYVRNGESMLTGKDELSYRSTQKPNNMSYQTTVDYKDWMDGAELRLQRTDYGCCNSILAEQASTIGQYIGDIKPELVYVKPQAIGEKSYSLEGSAYIDFVVNKTDINPSYRRNLVELGKIRATIDSVNSDRDITITQVWLKGYASPEGSYSHNASLAKGRTEALRNYIQQLYHFKQGIITAASEPEDWAGLRQYVEKSSIDNREAILQIIDSSEMPDAKEQKIRKSYPAQYKYLLDNCYPALRHTDYRIAYNIRTYSDIDEIKRVFASQPQKLSLNEFYLVAQTYEPGSTEFTNVFDTAVRLFPNDETANLNAANAAMSRDDLSSAQRYLQKAGSTAEAEYARGVYYVRTRDYSSARTHLEKASQQGITQANKVLEKISLIK